MNQHIHRVLCTQALFEASIHGHVDVVRMLLAHGANIDHAKNDGATALYGACENGYTSVASLLVESAANINLLEEDGCSPVLIASQSNQTDIVSMLLESGADPFISMDDGTSCLTITCYLGHSDCVRALLDGSANKAITRQHIGEHTLEGKTSLEWTAPNIRAGFGDLDEEVNEAGRVVCARMINSFCQLH